MTSLTSSSLIVAALLVTPCLPAAAAPAPAVAGRVSDAGPALQSASPRGIATPHAEAQRPRIVLLEEEAAKLRRMREALASATLRIDGEEKATTAKKGRKGGKEMMGPEIGGAPPAASVVPAPRVLIEPSRQDRIQADKERALRQFNTQQYFDLQNELRDILKR